MISQTIIKNKLPDSPGVYFFIGKNNNLLYIGKATSLRDRVRSYFRGDILDTRGPKIADMINRIKSVDFRKTDSVLEAMLLEADLIKKFKPEFNTADKDDKSFNCVVITDEDFPRVLIVRKKDLYSNRPLSNNGLKAIYGPFPEGMKLRSAIKIIRKIFPFRDKCIPTTGEPCFNRQIGLCSGVCTGEIVTRDYGKIIKNIMLLFKGKKKSIMSNLKKEMTGCAKRQEFEKAGEIKRIIASLSNIQDVALISEDKRLDFTDFEKNFRIEAFDVAHTAGTETVGVMTVIENGIINKSEYRMFKIKSAGKSDDIAGLKEILSRRLHHEEWRLPDLIVVDGGIEQKRSAAKIIDEIFIEAKDRIPVIAVTKNEFHRPKNILGDRELVNKHENSILLANAEAHRFAIAFHRKRRDKIH